MKENFDCSKKLMFLITIMNTVYAAVMLREFAPLNDDSVSTLFCKDSWMPPDTDLLDLERESGTVLDDFFDDQAYIRNYIHFRFLSLLYSSCVFSQDK